MKKAPRKSSRGRGRPASQINIDAWRAKAEHAIGREHEKRVRWIERARFEAAFRPLVAKLEALTAAWPRELAARVGDTPRAHARYLVGADSPHVPPVRFTEAVDPADVAAAARERAELEAEAPFMRPLVEALAARLPDSLQARALFRVLQPPRWPRLPPAPTTTAEARRQFLAANAQLTQRRTKLLRRAHFLERDAITAAVPAAAIRFRAGWWNARGALAGLAGNGPAALALAEQTRRDLLEDFGTLGGMLPAARAVRTGRGRAGIDKSARRARVA